MTTSSARVRTAHAKEYLAVLADISRRNGLRDIGGDTHALLQLHRGVCELVADEQFLDILITANSISDTVMLEDAVSEYLDDIASSEDLHYQWIMAPESPRFVPAANSSASHFRAVRRH